MYPKAWDKRAAKIVVGAIEDALAEMRDYVQRQLLAGIEPDRRMLVMMARGLREIADEYALDISSGTWGDMIEDAMRMGAADVNAAAGAVVMSIGKREVETALFKGYSLIKGILEDGEKVVAEEMVASIVGGKSKREVADSLAARLQVQREDGEMGAIPAWRAELVARNELSANYRTVKETAAREAGFTHRKMTGPMDDRTSAVCERHVGEIHSIEEWEAIGEREGIDPAYPLLTYGFHVNCRHDWDPVPQSEVPEEDAAAEATANA